MTKISKALGATIGGVAGLLISLGVLPATFDAAGFVENIDTLIIVGSALITTITSVVGAYSAPKNAE